MGPMSWTGLVSSIALGLPARPVPTPDRPRCQSRRLQRMLDRGVVGHGDRAPAAHRPDLAEALLDGDRRPLAARGHARSHDHGVPLFPHPLGLEADVFHVIPERLEVAAYPLMASVGVRLRRELRRHMPFEVRIDEIEDALYVAAAEGFQAPTDDLDVALRHAGSLAGVT